MKRMILLAAAAAALSASGVSAQTRFTDNFNGENGGATALSYTGFTNFNVTSGDVDLIGPGNPYGISCASGSCVDLDGASPGTLTTKNGYAFNAGDLVTLTASVSGNQRVGNSDSFFFNLVNGGTTYASMNFTTTSGTAPFADYVLQFTAATAGSVFARIGSTAGGNVGPILDNVRFSIAAGGAPAVPEPASWAMMILGMGAVGFAMRRRPGVVAHAA